MPSKTRLKLSPVDDNHVIEGVCYGLILRNIMAFTVTKRNFEDGFSFDEAMVAVGKRAEEICTERGLVSTSCFILGPLSGQCDAAQDALLRMMSVGIGYVRPPFYQDFFLSGDEERAARRLVRLAERTGLEPEVFKELTQIFLTEFHKPFLPIN